MNNSSLRILLLSLRYFTSFVYCFRSSLFSLAFEIILNIFPPTCQDFSCYHLVSTHVVFKVRPILSPSLFFCSSNACILSFKFYPTSCSCSHSPCSAPNTSEPCHRRTTQLWECAYTSLSCRLCIYKPGVVITLVSRARMGTWWSIHLKPNSQLDCKLCEGRKQLCLVPAVFIASSLPPDK